MAGHGKSAMGAKQGLAIGLVLRNTRAAVKQGL